MAGKSLNRVQLIGNLGKDPEIKYTPQGTPVAKITIATNERFKDKSGEWQDRTGRVSEEGRQGLHRRPPANPLLGRQDQRPEKIHDRSRSQ